MPYQYRDFVIFEGRNGQTDGYIVVIDRFYSPTGEMYYEYDILDEGNNVLYKHMSEDQIIKVISHWDGKK